MKVFDIMKLASRFEHMLLAILDELIDRYDRNPDYHFIDTKLDLLTGRDFGPEDAWYQRRETIYPWIQGRALEALAGHWRWLADCTILPAAGRTARRKKLERIMTEVAANMERLRRKNHGRMFFLMTEDGRFLRMNEQARPEPLAEIPGDANFSDLFYSKGLFAAGAVLGNELWRKRGESYFRRVVTAILAERFVTDQQMFDPKNPVLAVPGKLLQGPKMIALSGTALGMHYGSDPAYWERRGKALLDHVFRYHVKLSETPADLQHFDFWEAVHTDRTPWRENGKLICDPGHALEFVGLSLKNLLAVQTPAGKRNAAKLQKFYADFLRHQFQIGFAPGPGGIIKSFDLVSRQPVNTDMPWWSLPETIRAAALTFRFTGDRSVAEIITRCSHAFFDGYVRPECHQMAVQTRSAEGKVVPVIPATPDADPGYHTNLSIIDALPVIRELDL